MITGSVEHGLGFATHNLELQLPAIAREFPEVEDCYLGTINLRLKEPVEITRPDHRSHPIKWNSDWPAEIFEFVRIRFRPSSAETWVDGWLYIPALSPHRADPHKQEVLLREWVSGLEVGSLCQIEVPQRAIERSWEDSRMVPETDPTGTGPLITICVLTYGDHVELARRCIGSILKHCDRRFYRLVVGANAVGEETRRYLEQRVAAGDVDHLHMSAENINKCPMMRRMFRDVDTELIWWLDDDSHLLEAGALARRLELARAAPQDTVLWGHQFFFGHEHDFSYGTDVVAFVKDAPWYRGLEPPSWEPGGKDEWDFQGRGVGDGRWFFITGGSWLVRTSAIQALDWPDPRLVKRNDDVFLSEAVRQRGWRQEDIGPLAVKINDAPRRGEGEDRETMILQIQGASGTRNAVRRSAARPRSGGPPR